MGNLHPNFICRLSSGRVRFGYPFFAELFEYLVHDCNFELRLLQHASGIFIGWQNVELFLFSAASSESLHRAWSLEARVRGVSFTACSDARALCMPFSLHYETYSSSGPGFD